MSNLLIEHLTLCDVPFRPDFQAGGKRLLDIVASGSLLLCLSPMLLLIAGVVVTDRGPVLFAHRRVGRDGAMFSCLKFRTMRPDAQALLADLLARDPVVRAEWEATRKVKQDPRVTRVGRVLRATSLDELPQLLNVLRGEMSLVGPRPVLPEELDLYYAPAGARAAYLSVLPGITGPWQVGGRNNVSYAERVALDRAYAEKPSLVNDFRILFRTASAVVRRAGAY